MRFSPLVAAAAEEFGTVELDRAVMDLRTRAWALWAGIRWARAWVEEVGVEWVCAHRLGRVIAEDMGGERAVCSGERLAGGTGITE